MERPATMSLVWKDTFLFLTMIFVLLSPVPVIAFSVFNVNVFELKAPVPLQNSYEYKQQLRSMTNLSSILAAGGTLFVLGRGYRVWCLGKRGVVVTGRVVSVGSFTYKGMRDITYAFQFQERTIEVKESVPKVSTRFELNAEVHVLVDEQNPSRNMLL